MNGLNSSTFLTVVDFIRLLAPLVIGAVDGIASLVKVIKAIGANPEQEAALLVVAHEAVRAEQAKVKTAPRLDPNQPDQLLPAAP
jgi:hypothetical protein